MRERKQGRDGEATAGRQQLEGSRRETVEERQKVKEDVVKAEVKRVKAEMRRRIRGTYLDSVSAVVHKSKRDFGHVRPSLISCLLLFYRVDF